MNSSILKDTEMIDIEAGKDQVGLPVLYSPGWAETYKSSKFFLDALSEHKRVLTLNQPRDLRIKKGKDGFGVTQTQRAMALLDVLEKKELGKVDAIGYSEGGMILAIAASFQPEKFRKIVLVVSSGLNGKDSFLGMSSRFIFNNNLRFHRTMMRNPELKKKGRVVKKDFYGYIFKNPIRSLKEVRAMHRTEIYEILEELKNRGVEMTFVFGKDDPIYDGESIRKEIEKRGLGRFVLADGDHVSLKYDREFQDTTIHALDQTT